MPRSRRVSVANASGSGPRIVLLRGVVEPEPGDPETGREKGPALAGHWGPVLALAFPADGSLLVSGSEDGTALAWDLGGPAAAPGPRTPRSR